MDKLSELAARCEAATHPYTGLDHMIGEATGIGARAVRLRGQPLTEYPSFTASLDAAMTLVPEGWRFAGSETMNGDFYAHLITRELVRDGGKAHAEATADTFALALCAAALRARAASGIETEGHDREDGHGAEHESPAPKGDAIPSAPSEPPNKGVSE